MKRLMGFLLVGLMVAGTATICRAADNSAKEVAATKAATAWLQLVDNEKYGESWDTAATLFKNAVSKDKWTATVRQVRSPLGTLISRKVKSTTYTTSLPGAPDGQYVVIQFVTSYANKKTATETVTPMIDKDGNWHVSGYFIR